jgi:trimeric autotransporter adhesin
MAQYDVKYNDKSQAFEILTQRGYRKVVPLADHVKLLNLDWEESAHTGSALSIAAFDSSGEAVLLSHVSSSALDAIGILDDKGDILGHNGTTHVAVPSGTNGYVFTVDSTATPGVAWKKVDHTAVDNIFWTGSGHSAAGPAFAGFNGSNEPSLVAYPLPINGGGTNAQTAQTAFNNLTPQTNVGDLIVYSSSNSAARLASGTHGQILTVDTGSTTGVSWKTSAAAGDHAGLSNLTWDASAHTGTANSAVIFDNAGTARTLSFPLPIVSGGTGQSTAIAGFNALSPMTNIGDMIVYSSSNSAVRIATGSQGQVLTVDSGSTTGVSWKTPSATGGGLTHPEIMSRICIGV